MNRMKMLTSCAIFAVLQASMVQAQLTWDPVAGDGVVTHSNGVWDTSTANWTTDGGINNGLWVNGDDAVFTANTSNSTITVDLGTGVQVGNLTMSPPSGTGAIQIYPIVDGDTLTVATGGATWDLGGRTLTLGNNQAQDLNLSIGSGETLAITSSVAGGVFYTGENPNTGSWSASGATLDVQSPATVKGHNGSVGQFDVVKMLGGSTYSHERNTSQTYANNWELGPGVVTFQNKWTGGNGNITLNGIVSGPGAMNISVKSDKFLKLANTNNTFSGGVIVESEAELLVSAGTGDGVFGAIPASFDADNITLRDNGELKMQDVTINPNRGITLDNGGIIVNTGAPNTYGGKITGTGPLQIGRAAGSDGNTLILTSNTHDYTGGTWIYQGSITLDIDNALPTNGVLNIGGLNKNGRLFMEGFDLTIGGLDTAEGGSSSKEIVNNGAGNDSTLTINVADGENYSYDANINGSNQIHIVKNGLGTQRFSKNNYTTEPASLTINGGFLAWNSGEGPTGLTTVNSGGTLGGIGTLSTNVVLNSGARIAPGNPGGHNTLAIQGDLDLSAMASDNAGGIEISFGGFGDKIVVTNAAGTGTIDMNGTELFDLGFADFTFIDTVGIASGVYTVMVANVINGNVNPTDGITAQPIGDKGAMGTLSLTGGNAIVLTVTAGDYSAFGTWTTGYGLIGANAATNADPDADNYSNIQEYAYGGDPTNSAVQGFVPVSSVIVDGSTNWLTYSYSCISNGVSVTAKRTDSLIYTAPSTNGVTLLGTNSDNDPYITYTNGIPMDGTVDFLGIFVEKTP